MMQRSIDVFCLQMPMVFRKNKSKSIVLLCTVLPFLVQVFYDSGDSLSFFNVKGSKFWVQTIIFTMKYIEIRKSFIEYCSPPRANKSFCMYMC